MAEHLSPFHQIHVSLGANFKTYHNWSLPADYGDENIECEKLYNGCCAFDLSSFGRINISGVDAEKLIDYVVAGFVLPVEPGMVKSSIICSEKGHIVDFVRLIAKNKGFTVITTPPKREMVYKIFVEAVKSLSLGNVEVDDDTQTTAMIGLYGAEAFELANKMLPLNLNDMVKGSSREFNVFMITANVLRSSAAGVDGIEIITNSKAAMMAGMAIEKYEKQGLIQAGGMDCLNRAMLESSLPISAECRSEQEKYNIYSLAIADKVNFEKDFLGKDALLEGKDEMPKKTVVGLKVKGVKKRHYNLNVQYDDGRIGWLDILDHSSVCDCGVGIAIIDAEYGDLSDEVQIERDGLIMGAEIVKLPIVKDLANSVYC